MAMTLLLVYIFVFILQVVLLVRSIQKKQKKLWLGFFAFQLISALLAAGLCWYYETLPGGMFGGLTYMGEVLFSFGAAVVYGLFFLVSAFCCMISSNH